jgi:hypothetical protein
MNYLLHMSQDGGSMGEGVVTKDVSSVCKWAVSWAGHVSPE